MVKAKKEMDSKKTHLSSYPVSSYASDVFKPKNIGAVMKSKPSSHVPKSYEGQAPYKVLFGWKVNTRIATE